ncbi:hypothetical protein [Methylotenera sp.]|uniref:hypothetical protein n=1 Tax=Methylotenera sp. TaxID=2051956 RepID=UPI002488A0D3|nr:hypothetical protein [Methylotenera sp.]MDI1362503.1 hypothetical protein [Methylotenera sp.]
MLKIDNLKLSATLVAQPSSTDVLRAKSLSQRVDIQRYDPMVAADGVWGPQPVGAKPYKWAYLPQINTPGMSLAQTGVAASFQENCSPMPKLAYTILNLDAISVRFSLTLRYGGNFGVVFVANGTAFSAQLSQQAVRLEMNFQGCFEFIAVLRPTKDMVGKTITVAALLTKYPAYSGSPYDSVDSLYYYRYKALLLKGEYTETIFPASIYYTGFSNPYIFATHALLEVG